MLADEFNSVDLVEKEVSPMYGDPVSVFSDRESCTAHSRLEKLCVQAVCGAGERCLTSFRHRLCEERVGVVPDLSPGILKRHELERRQRTGTDRTRTKEISEPFS